MNTSSTKPPWAHPCIEACARMGNCSACAEEIAAARNQRTSIREAYRHLYEARDAFLRAGDEQSANEVGLVKTSLDRRLFGRPTMRWEMK